MWIRVHEPDAEQLLAAQPNATAQQLAPRRIAACANIRECIRIVGPYTMQRPPPRDLLQGWRLRPRVMARRSVAPTAARRIF